MGAFAHNKLYGSSSKTDRDVDINNDDI